ncbi:hypothetical protein BC937DRAFT_94575 [Endogone sp. FLAS-F59071]|nr:hypothetical protein BC937DRAFT_94575 [Endogone sp. FLAS-F59071]|eukprot:RUS20693.1 hypothetical protein BC937DRAFT_94575 [Endogone sp. FLAS-F59071]
MLLTTFDGTHRPGLLDAFRRSGAGYSLIELTSPNIEIYKNILLELFKKLACYPVEAKALCDVRNSRMWGQYTIVLSSTVCNWQLQYSTFPPLQMVYIFPESDLREQKKGVGRCLDVACEDSCISNYPRYIKRLSKLDAIPLLRVLTPALLGLPLEQSPSSKVLESAYTWEDLALCIYQDPL